MAFAGITLCVGIALIRFTPLCVHRFPPALPPSPPSSTLCMFCIGFGAVAVQFECLICLQIRVLLLVCIYSAHTHTDWMCACACIPRTRIYSRKMEHFQWKFLRQFILHVHIEMNLHHITKSSTINSEILFNRFVSKWNLMVEKRHAHAQHIYIHTPPNEWTSVRARSLHQFVMNASRPHFQTWEPGGLRFRTYVLHMCRHHTQQQRLNIIYRNEEEEEEEEKTWIACDLLLCIHVCVCLRVYRIVTVGHRSAKFNVDIIFIGIFLSLDLSISTIHITHMCMVYTYKKLI